MSNKTLIRLLMMFAVQCASTTGASTADAADSKVLSLPNNYVVFFEPKLSELDPAAQAIVRKAAVAIGEQRPSRIEIVVPAKVPGGRDVIDARRAAILKIISDSDVDASRVILSTDGLNLPGAADRAEIRLIP